MKIFNQEAVSGFYNNSLENAIRSGDLANGVTSIRHKRNRNSNHMFVLSNREADVNFRYDPIKEKMGLLKDLGRLGFFNIKHKLLKRILLGELDIDERLYQFSLKSYDRMPPLPSNIAGYIGAYFHYSNPERVFLYEDFDEWNHDLMILGLNGSTHRMNPAIGFQEGTGFLSPEIEEKIDAIAREKTTYSLTGSFSFTGTAIHDDIINTDNDGHLSVGAYRDFQTITTTPVMNEYLDIPRPPIRTREYSYQYNPTTGVRRVPVVPGQDRALNRTRRRNNYLQR